MRGEDAEGGPLHRILVVEDQWFLATEMEEMLRAAGLEVLGPVDTVADALRLIEAAMADGGLGAAVLDIQLGGEEVTPVADALAAFGVPFVYATGYPAQHAPGRHDSAPLLESS